ncbi:endonuclease G [Lutibacter agarilyticus]|uniref:Endonuclease G n=1 Tax=Lutibacter agarilyticus TaxID=1109740 RepID=A0A238WNE0_9FLAO|nr:DNA/RNA non-specific endonuclease [Lutibacter agarilyticus]SNR47199.1 endonuclease G [Lutibacter agarilyticus]
MRNRKFIYTLISILFAVGFYVYDNYDTEEISVSNNTKNTSVTNFLPTSTTGEIAHHNFYSVSYNEAFEQAEWVAYELENSHIKSANFKRPYFVEDPKISTKSASYRNYKNSGYNKGHLCPAGDRKFSKEAFDETFLMSNVTPQTYEFNSGVWNRLEQKVRYWAKKHRKLYVVTGGILTQNLKRIGNEKVAVPKYFYKIVLDYQEPEIKAVAFLMPHKKSEKGLHQFVVSIDEIEQKTGIDFFPELEDSLETKLESSMSYTKWNFR